MWLRLKNFYWNNMIYAIFCARNVHMRKYVAGIGNWIEFEVSFSEAKFIVSWVIFCFWDTKMKLKSFFTSFKDVYFFQLKEELWISKIFLSINVYLKVEELTIYHGDIIIIYLFILIICVGAYYCHCYAEIIIFQIGI